MFRPFLSAKVIVVAAPVLVSSLALAADAEGFRTYSNARFGYTLQYPSALLVARKEADNGDGRRFESRDRKVLLRSFGARNINNQSVIGKLKSVAADWRTDGAQITYQKSGDGWYALSGFVGGDIFYEKALLRNGTFATIIWEYPKSYRQQLDTSVTHSVRSFRFAASKQVAARTPTRSTASIPKPRPMAMRPAPHAKGVAAKVPVKALPQKQNTVAAPRKTRTAPPAPRATSSRGY